MTKNSGKNRKSKIKKRDKNELKNTTNSLHPRFSFYLSHRKYCPSVCSERTKKLLVDKLVYLGKNTWSQINQFPRETGFEKIEKNSIIPEATEGAEKQTYYLSTRLDERMRMVGFREKEVFHIIWIEEDQGKVYPHG